MMTLLSNPSGPYEAAASDYLARGWSPLSLPAGQKAHPLRGWTGYGGRYVETPSDVEVHAKGNPGGNVCLRLPETVIGIDVDAYGDKVGARTLADHEVRWGLLPDTWRSSSRDSPSGISFYRVPPGQMWRDVGEHVDTISWHHRYAVVEPSTNPADGDSQYRWHGPDGLPCAGPAVQDLPDLPEEWVRELAKGAAHVPSVATPADVVPLAAAAAGKRVKGALDTLRRAGEGSRNNTLNWAAYLLGGLWARLSFEEQVGEFDADVLRDTLEAIACDLGLTGREVGATLESGWDAGVADPMRAAGDCDAPGAAGLPPVDVTNSATATSWLLDEVGREKGPLAGLFQRGRGLVHVPRIGEEGYAPLTDDDEEGIDGPAQVREVGVDRLRSEIQFRYAVTKMDKEGWTFPALFPVEAAKTVINGLDHAESLRLLRGVTHTPMLRVNGSGLDAPGYDEVSRRAYLPLVGFTVRSVPDRPTAAEVAAARSLVESMIADFPFNSEHDRANYWCALLTPLLRELVPPPYKMIVINAHQRGSGKSLLAWVMRELHGGVLRGDAPPTGEEFGKQITALLSTTTAPVVQFDNVTKLKATQLDALLTSDVWSDRRLGVSETVTRRNDRLWVATGNNIVLGGDLTRRVLWVSIDPSVPRPEARTDFAIMDLKGWVRDRRGELLAALLTVVRAWVVAGSRPARQRGADDFARWLTVCQGILDAAGVDGTIGHEDTVQQIEADEDVEWGEFLAAVEAEFGERPWLAKDLIGYVDIEAAVPSGLDLFNVRSVGKWLLNRRGRWAGGLRVVPAGEVKNTKTWRIERHGGDQAS